MSISAGHIVFIGKVWPEPVSSAAGTRIVQLIHSLKTAGFRITFLSSAQTTPFSVRLDEMNCDFAHVELNDSSFNKVIENLNPDVVIFDRFTSEEQFGWRVEDSCPNAIRVLDTEDLHFLRDVREKCWKRGEMVTQTDLLSSDIAKRELASIYRCDTSLIISKVEMKLLMETFNIPAPQLLYLPLWVDFSNSKHNPDWGSRKGFVSIGNFLHKPNLEAVRFLKKSLWPLIIQQRRNLTLNIYGAYMPDEIRAMHHPESGFLVHGRAVNAREAISKTRCLLAPLFFGAGIKGKILDAITTGTPVITTPIGAEGMFDADFAPGFVTDSVNQMAEQAVLLHDQPDIWYKASNNGYSIIKDDFFKDDWFDVLPKKLLEIKTTLHERRENNIVGSLLLHHTHHTSRYMSKWIEAKNKCN